MRRDLRVCDPGSMWKRPYPRVLFISIYAPPLEAKRAPRVLPQCLKLHHRCLGSWGCFEAKAT